MLLNAMDAYILRKPKKLQYANKGDTKTYFRASELGMDDRKIFLSFFKHQIPTKKLTPKALRVYEIGDMVHEGYQNDWEQMGCLLSKEVQVSSKDDPHLSKYDWELCGHYDGLLDANILYGIVTGKMDVPLKINDDEVFTRIDPEYKREIGFGSPDYKPLPLVVDVKTMNPWVFDQIRKYSNFNYIDGYVLQIMFYMYMVNTPYGAIFCENKENQDRLEVQVLWEDFKGSKYDYHPRVFSEEGKNVKRLTVQTERFNRLLERLSRLWGLVTEVQHLTALGDHKTIEKLVPEKCSLIPSSFPCSWGHKNGKPNYCEFYDHCWNIRHHGNTVIGGECPQDKVWTFELFDGGMIRIDSRKTPYFTDTPQKFLEWVNENDIDLSTYEIKDQSKESAPQPAPEPDILDKDGNLITNIDTNNEIKEATEYITIDGLKAIKCPYCSFETVYRRLVNGHKNCNLCLRKIKVNR